MKHSLIHTLKLTMISTSMVLAMSVAPTVAFGNFYTFDGYSYWGKGYHVDVDHSPDSEYSTLELPHPPRAVGIDLIARTEWDEPDSEYSLEELPAPVKEIEVEPAIEMEWSEPDSEY